MTKIAFSLGGLGGSNAHSAGFLAAARDLGVRPDLIACTSGPLLWVYYYINDIDLTEKFEKLPHYPHPPYKFFDPQLYWQVGEFMYVAFSEYVARWMYPFPFKHSNGDWMKDITDWWLDRLLPAHCLNESHGDEWFNKIADAFNNANTPGKEKPLGIVFNVFEPGTGTEYLHVNKTAYDVLVNKRKGKGREEEDKVHKVKIEEPPITGDAVRNALRFWLYGFERPMVPWSYWFGTRPPLSCIDGGYHRQIILRELHDYDSIYTVRPENESWMGELPRNMLELTDLLVELWFNSSYAGDVAGLELINKLIDNHELGDGYKHVEIIPVQVKKNYGFIDYFGENRDLFFAAYKQSCVRLADDIVRHPETEPASTPLATTVPHAA